jgi:hypothetical protein
MSHGAAAAAAKGVKRSMLLRQHLQAEHGA